MKDFDNSDKKLFKLANNIHGNSFLLLKKKTSYYHNKITIVVAIMYMLYYTCNEQ